MTKNSEFHYFYRHSKKYEYAFIQYAGSQQANRKLFTNQCGSDWWGILTDG